jgi:diadenosine tetraphosphate (Ap4A) HIT family hydrolase
MTSSYFSWKSIKYNYTGQVIDCPFCNIRDHKDNHRLIIRENDKFIAFPTRDPVTSCHVLVCPKPHIKNLSSLTKDDVGLVKDLYTFARETLGEDQSASAIFSFHRPPCNSVDHLHLHCISNVDTMSTWSQIKYYRGVPWCVTADEVIRNLETET